MFLWNIIKINYFKKYLTELTLLYVCTMPYQARFEGDLSLKYTDRVRVLHATEDYALVKKINGSYECGYVSTRCLISLSEFLKRL